MDMMDATAKQSGSVPAEGDAKRVSRRKGKGRSISEKVDAGMDITQAIIKLLVEAQERRNAGERPPQMQMDDLLEIRRYVQYRLEGHAWS